MQNTRLSFFILFIYYFFILTKRLFKLLGCQARRATLLGSQRLTARNSPAAPSALEGVASDRQVLLKRAGILWRALLQEILRRSDGSKSLSLIVHNHTAHQRVMAAASRHQTESRVSSDLGAASYLSFRKGRRRKPSSSSTTTQAKPSYRPLCKRPRS